MTGIVGNRQDSWAEDLGIPKLELLGIAPHDGDTGAESGISEVHPSSLAAFARGHYRNEYMQELPESVQQMVGSVYAMLTTSKDQQRVM